MLHPESRFERYKEKIRDLDAAEKDGILSEDFLLGQDSGVQVYYAPHNEYVNEKARVLVVGITPGWSQTKIAYQTAQRALRSGRTDAQVCFECKIASRFAGTMRGNLISMLGELRLQEGLGLKSCQELFAKESSLLHTTSLIRYPCFYRGKNYGGHTPPMASVGLLRRYIRDEFPEELSCIPDLRLIIPLGTAVESVLRTLLEPESALHGRVLWGFPHPSGLNGRRKAQFEANRERMAEIAKDALHKR